MRYSIIQKSQLESGLRLDAEYYQPQFLELIKNLNNLGAVSIKKIAEPIKRKFKPKEDNFFDYIEISEVNLETGEYNVQKIIGKEAPDRAQWIVKKDDVLVSTVRPIRNAVVLIKEENENLVCSSGFAVLRPEKISPQYLFIYLKTKPIIKLLDRRTTATMYPAITIEDILDTKIYLGDENFKQEIKNKVIEAQKELENSKSLYSQAENLLLEELGLKDFEIEDHLSYIVNLSEVKKSHRVDAEYFQPKYEKLVKKLKKYGANPLLNLAQNVAARFNPKSQPAKLFQYVELSNITSSVGTIDGFSEVSGNEAPSRAKRVLRTNDIVFSSVEGSLGKVALVGKEQEGYLASNGFFQFRSKKILLEVLLVLAKSFVLQMQFEKETAGTILTAVPREAVKNVVVPRINKSVQQKIADLVQKSHEARSKAKQLLEQAKQNVENLIEK
jgi:type I restriction enzyme S subunit/type I restriction enzyme M protein